MSIKSNIDVRGGWLQWVRNGQEMHRWHPSKIYRGNGFNFATKIAIWDWIFGTAHLPKGEKPIGYGLGGDAPFPDGYFRQTVYAFCPRENHPPALPLASLAPWRVLFSRRALSTP